MSESKRLEEIARIADLEARRLRQLAAQLGSLHARVIAVMGGTATAEDHKIIGEAQHVRRELDNAANAFFAGAKQSRAAAAEARQREGR